MDDGYISIEICGGKMGGVDVFDTAIYMSWV